MELLSATQLQFALCSQLEEVLRVSLADQVQLSFRFHTIARKLADGFEHSKPRPCFRIHDLHQTLVYE